MQLGSNVNIKRARRLTIASITLSLIALWSSLGYFMQSSREAVIESEKRVLERLAKAVEGQTYNLFSFLNYFLISADQWFVVHPYSDPRTDPDFLRLVDAFKAKTGYLADIRLVSQEGGLFYLRKTGDKPLANVADRDYVRAQHNLATRGFYIGKPVRGRVTGHWGLPISYPLRSNPNDISVIFAVLENRVFERSFDVGRTRGGTILLAHRDGTVLFRIPNENAAGRSIAQGQVWQHELAKKSSGVLEVESGAYDGRSRIVAYASVPEFPLVVIVSSATDDVLASWKIRLRNVLLFGGTLTLLGLIGLWRMLRALHTLEIMGKQLTEQANMDFLTNVANRRYFMAHLQQEMARALRYQRTMSCLMFDLDHFKQVNDQFGHEAGDLVLKEVCRAAQGELRQEDLLGRLGGEEFAILLPETSLAQAIEVAERVRNTVENRLIRTSSGQLISVSISVGIAERVDPDEDITPFMMRADRALYRAKNTGRNRVCTDPEMTPPKMDDPANTLA
ncbi:diguanylate cyclase [Chitinibacter sp. S2-10]|uniref:GGDEF domain-containing protein n=1 Tax=Chitinibacter sp. S2-10 TaxID=3373597 RepID=UPI00397769FD